MIVAFWVQVGVGARVRTGFLDEVVRTAGPRFYCRVWGKRQCMVEMSVNELVPVLQLAIGPVIVISGVGLVLLSMTNRYGRAIDRSRHLAEQRRAGGQGRIQRLTAQIDVLVRRARLLRQAIVLASASLLFVAFIIIALFVMALAKLDGGPVIIALFVACMGSLVGSLVLFMVDINLSLKALDLDIEPGN